MTRRGFCVTVFPMIFQRIVEIRKNIQEICVRTRRDAQDIKIIAVTKYTDIRSAREAIEAGIEDIGENRVQDAAEKFQALQSQGLSFRRHMIGHLQTNKVKQAVELFDMIQSVDSLKVAREIDKHAAKLKKIMDVLVQVNSSAEEQKSGVSPEDALRLLNDISVFEHIRVRGLMTIGPLTEDRAQIGKCFQKMNGLFKEAKECFKEHPRMCFDELSMGMTQDYDLAVEHGATMVRIGSAIFQRSKE